MSVITKLLNVKEDACNTCLTLHILIGLLQNKIISASKVVEHGDFLYTFLSSKCVRDGDVTVPRLLSQMELVSEVNIVIIQKTVGDTFLIHEKDYGTGDQIKLYIVHSGNHFFLACPLFDPPINQVVVLPPLPKVVQPGSYESVNFGPPPDDSFEDDDVAVADDFFDFNF